MKILLIFCLLSTPVLAQAPVCGGYNEGMENLKERYNEIPVWIGKRSDGTQVVVTQSPKGTWSVLVTHPDQNDPNGGVGCLVLDGGPEGDPT